MIVAGTGHRPNKLGFEYDYKGTVSKWLRDQVRAYLLEKKAERVISGMAQGFDTILALTAIELQISVLAAVPFEGQESSWPEASRRLYHEILSHKLVTKHVVAPGSYNVFKLQNRNRFMVDQCDRLLACWDGSMGGTHNTIVYAQEVGKPVDRIRPQDRIKP